VPSFHRRFSSIDDAGRDEGVDVRVESQQRSEAMRCGDEGAHREVQGREALCEVIADDGVGGAAEGGAASSPQANPG